MSIGPWEKEEFESGSWNGVVSSADGSILYLYGNYTNIYKSTDYGASFTKLTTLPADSAGPRNLTTNEDGTKVYMCINSSTNGFVYYSYDGGNTWSQSNLSVGNYRNIWCSQDGTKVILSDTLNVYYSSDSGQTYTTIYTIPTNEVAITCVRISGNGNRLALCTQGGNVSTPVGKVYISDDINHTNFTAYTVGNLINLYSLAVNNDGTQLYVSTSRYTPANTTSVYKLNTLTNTFDPITITSTSNYPNAYANVTINGTGDIVCALPFTNPSIAPNFDFSVNIQNQLYISTDFGVTWTLYQITNMVQQINCPISFLNINNGATQSSNVIATTYRYNSLFISRNFSNIWLRLLNLGSPNVNSIAVNNDASKVVFSTLFGWLYNVNNGVISKFSTNGFPSQIENFQYRWITFNYDGTKLFVVGNNMYIYEYTYSTDTWRDIFGSDYTLRSTYNYISSSVDGNVLIFCGRLFANTAPTRSIFGLFKLTYNQTTQNYDYSTLSNSIFYNVNVCLLSEDLSFIVGFSNGLIDYSTNGGGSWTTTTLTGQNIARASMNYDGNYIYYTTSSTLNLGIVYKITNKDFNNISSVTILQGNTINGITTNYVGDSVAVSIAQSIYISNDYGQTFSQRIPNGSNNTLPFLAIQYNSINPNALRLNSVTDGQYIVTGTFTDIFLSSNGGLSCYLKNSLVKCMDDYIPIQNIRSGMKIYTNDGELVTVTKVVMGRLNPNFDSKRIYVYEKDDTKLYVLEGHSFLYESQEEADKNKKSDINNSIYDYILSIKGYYHVLAKDHIYTRHATKYELNEFIEDGFINYYHIICGNDAYAIHVNDILTETMSGVYYSSIKEEMAEINKFEEKNILELYE